MARIFLRNKYTKWYLGIVKILKDRPKEKGQYYEYHHILPTSIFPKYKNLKKYSWNGVYVTPKEHIILHQMLTKMTNGKNRYRMLNAICIMNRLKLPPYLFALHRKEMRAAISECRKNSELCRQTSIKNIKNAIPVNRARKGEIRGEGKGPWKKGQKFPEVLTLKMKKSAIRRAARICCCIYCRKEIPSNNEFRHYNRCSARNNYTPERKWIHNNVITKMISIDEIVPEGWILGRPVTWSGNGGRFWITDGKLNRMIIPNTPLPEGWRKGRTKN